MMKKEGLKRYQKLGLLSIPVLLIIWVFCLVGLPDISWPFGGDKEQTLHDEMVDMSPTDEEQTVYQDKSKGTESKSNTIVDVVQYQDLEPGRTYTITGSLYKKDGTVVTTSTQEFTADDSNGEVLLEYNIEDLPVGEYQIYNQLDEE